MSNKYKNKDYIKTKPKLKRITEKLAPEILEYLYFLNITYDEKAETGIYNTKKNKTVEITKTQIAFYVLNYLLEHKTINNEYKGTYADILIISDIVKCDYELIEQIIKELKSKNFIAYETTKIASEKYKEYGIKHQPRHKNTTKFVLMELKPLKIQQTKFKFIYIINPSKANLLNALVSKLNLKLKIQSAIDYKTAYNQRNKWNETHPDNKTSLNKAYGSILYKRYKNGLYIKNLIMSVLFELQHLKRYSFKEICKIYGLNHDTFKQLYSDYLKPNKIKTLLNKLNKECLMYDDKDNREKYINLLKQLPYINLNGYINQ